MFDKRQRSRNNERNWDEDTDVSQHNEDLAYKLRSMRSVRRNELAQPREKKQRRNPDKLNRHFTLAQKWKMVALRFGSLTDFRFRKMTYARVAARMKCWLINVYHTIKRFLENGFSHPPDGRTVRVVRPEITQDMIDDITSKKKLEAWSHLSMPARTELLTREYPDHRFNLDVLKKIYKDEGITYTQR